MTVTSLSVATGRRVRWNEIKRENPGDPGEVGGVARDESRANVAARSRNENIEREASTDVAKHEALIFDERGERRAERLPRGRRRIQQSTTPYIGRQNLPL